MTIEAIVCRVFSGSQCSVRVSFKLDETAKANALVYGDRVTVFPTSILRFNPLHAPQDLNAGILRLVA